MLHNDPSAPVVTLPNTRSLKLGRELILRPIAASDLEGRNISCILSHFDFPFPRVQTIGAFSLDAKLAKTEIKVPTRGGVNDEEKECDGGSCAVAKWLGQQSTIALIQNSPVSPADLHRFDVRVGVSITALLWLVSGNVEEEMLH